MGPWPTPSQMAATPTRSPEACRGRARAQDPGTARTKRASLAVAPPGRFMMVWTMPPELMHASCGELFDIFDGAYPGPSGSRPLLGLVRCLPWGYPRNCEVVAVRAALGDAASGTSLSSPVAFSDPIEAPHMPSDSCDGVPAVTVGFFADEPGAAASN